MPSPVQLGLDLTRGSKRMKKIQTQRYIYRKVEVMWAMLTLVGLQKPLQQPRTTAGFIMYRLGAGVWCLAESKIRLKRSQEEGRSVPHWRLPHVSHLYFCQLHKSLLNSFDYISGPHGSVSKSSQGWLPGERLTLVLVPPLRSQSRDCVYDGHSLSLVTTLGREEGSGEHKSPSQ